MITPRKQFKNINEFIESFSPNVQKILSKLRKTIREAAPEAEGAMHYGIPNLPTQ